MDTPFAINRIILVRLIALVALLVIVWIGLRRPKLVPGRFQGALEIGLEFVRNDIAIDVLGKELGRKYFPVLATILFSIFFFNITGVVPGLNIAGSSVIGLPLMFALWVYVLYIGGAIRKFGFVGFLKTNLFPPGVPPFLYVLLTPIEALQVFILRPATLAIRLLANMMAGHMLLALSFGASWYLLFQADLQIKAFGLVTALGAFAFYGLEIFVAALQAYIFTMLTAVYLQMSLEPEH